MLTTTQPTPAGTHLTIIDPATGQASPNLNPSGIQAASAAIGGYSGIIYAGIERSDNTTDVAAMDVRSGEIETIGSVKGPATVRRITPDGGIPRHGGLHGGPEYWVQTTGYR